MSFVRAIAVDYDGTLVSSGRTPSADVLSALAESRAEGRRVLLVTGRILSELRADFPEVDSHVDAIVAENGGVLSTPGRGDRALALPVPDELAAALAARGVPVRVGQVLLAIDGVHEPIVHEEARRLGLEVQLVRNRDALMVLPPGVTKGSGLFAALGVLGISHHSAIGFGDAENDHSLLQCCEIGIAVENAVPALKAHADLVLKEPNGAGIAGFLRGPVVSGAIRLVPERWRVEIGRFPDGSPATVPASRAGVLIAGETGTGKSWLAGLLAERLIEADYSVAVLDPEGDHTALGRLRGAITVGGTEGAPNAASLRQHLQHRFGSVIADLSALSVEEKRAWHVAALDQLEGLRRESGLPHWIFLDEAQLSAAASFSRYRAGAVSSEGFCFVTWRPREIEPAVMDTIDVVLLTSPPDDGSYEWLPDRFFPDRVRAQAANLRPGEALRITAGSVRAFRTGMRAVKHIRHWHKYVTARLPESQCFHFRTSDRGTGRSAANLAEFHHEIANAPGEALAHHAANGDFSKWTERVIQDSTLASRFRAIESRWATADPITAEALRAQVMESIRERYLNASD